MTLSSISWHWAPSANLELYLAKRKSRQISQVPNVKAYPSQVKAATKTFTKLTSSSSVGASNTSAGYCMLINLKHLSNETRNKLLHVLDRNDVVLAELSLNEESVSDEGDLIASQDFPHIYQSQTSETLQHCNLCEFMSQSKVDFEYHMKNHPVCTLCQK